MTEELKKIFFSPKILNIFYKHDWILNKDKRNKYHSYFVGEIADYYLDIFNNRDKIYFQFTLNIEITNSKLHELLILINVANQNSVEGFFVYDLEVKKIKYNLIFSYLLLIQERTLQEFLKIKLASTRCLFDNFVSGAHNLIYGEKIEGASLKLLFLNNQGRA